MKTLSEAPHYSDLKREVEALRKRLEALESGRVGPKPAGRATRWRWLAAKPALALTAVMGAVLALGVLSAQNKQDPLFIGPNGTVSIGSARFSNIGINQDPWPGQKLIITGDGTDIPLNVTNPANLVSWLVVSKDGNVLMNGGNVGVVGAPGSPGFDISKASPKLEVSGSSHLTLGTGKGDSWFPYYDGDSYVSGTNVIFRSNGNTERMRLTSGGDIGIGTTAPNAKLDVNGNAVVSGGLTVKGEIRGKLWTSQEYEWKYTRQVPTQMTKADHSVCFLTYAKALSGWGESVEIKKNAAGYWALTGTSGPGMQTEARAMCVGVPD